MARPSSKKPPPPRLETATVAFRLNGRATQAAMQDHWTLLAFLRDGLGLTGAKEGCNLGECGACTVLLDGKAVYACSVLAREVEGRVVTTIEGLAKGERLDPLQEAFLSADALQCGFCIPGQILAAKALLADYPNPDPETIRRGLSGNLCRCGCYLKIVEAVTAATQAGQRPAAAGRSKRSPAKARATNA